MLSKMLQIGALNNRFGNFFHFYFEKQVIGLVKKIKTKKIINVFTFFTQINNALIHKFPLAIFYCTPYFKKILAILKQEFFIFNYFQVPLHIIPTQLLTGSTSKVFLENLICVIFKPTNLFGNLCSLSSIVFISTPSRIIFVTHKQLNKLVNINTNSIFLLNTAKGIVTHKIAMKEKIGGALLCKVS